LATSISIANIITDRISETERILTADSNVDWANAKLRAIALAKLGLYGYEISEGSVGDARIIKYIGLKACLDLIPLAIDFYMEHETLSEGKQGESTAYYNRVAVLEGKLTRIKAEIASMKDEIEDLIDDSQLADSQPSVSTLHTTTVANSACLTPSPWGMRGK
jgi:hypothetical protein